MTTRLTSRVPIAVVDELDDEAKRRYHVAIFQNKPLLQLPDAG